MEYFKHIELSELDQIMPRLYVRWLLCFPTLKDSPSKERIIDIIKSGVRTTLEALPILTGNVVPKSSDPSRVEVRVPTSEIKRDFKLQVKSYDEVEDPTMPTYERLKKGNFPVSELPDKLLAPANTPSTPVFDLQATFIRGGLLLCIKCHHAVIDGAGLGLVIKLLAQNCYLHANPHIPREAPSLPSMERSVLPHGLKDPRLNELGFNILVGSKGTETAAIKEYEPMTSHIFKFSANSLRQLKAACITSSVNFTSHDVLTALLYSAVSYARSLRLSKICDQRSSVPSTMGIAVNGRRRLKPPMAGYAGNLTLYAAFSSPLSLPCDPIPSEKSTDITYLSTRLNLPYLASQTHATVASVTEPYILSTMELASSLSDVSKLVPSFSDFYQGTDFFITSGADLPVFDHEWWPGGFVEEMRIPLKAQWDGSCAVLATKDKSTGLDVLLGLREDDMLVAKRILFAFGAYIV
ncbi:hypothetical protein V501_03023 [Pseudogymnoascus sp. VKM F-4519 (FW-2642)]|nr:hypothetical protein V501_03023 [Pseudogymnoascus sp. VKM F-4519 (FW-2642)]